MTDDNRDPDLWDPGHDEFEETPTPSERPRPMPVNELLNEITHIIQRSRVRRELEVAVAADKLSALLLLAENAQIATGYMGQLYRELDSIRALAVAATDAAKASVAVKMIARLANAIFSGKGGDR